jgi:hypothetical protein
MTVDTRALIMPADPNALASQREREQRSRQHDMQSWVALRESVGIWRSLRRRVFTPHVRSGPSNQGTFPL